jgi:hypothetical protein
LMILNYGNLEVLDLGLVVLLACDPTRNGL